MADPARASIAIMVRIAPTPGSTGCRLADRPAAPVWPSLAVAVAAALYAGATGGLAHPGSSSPCSLVERAGVGLDLSVPLVGYPAESSR